MSNSTKFETLQDRHERQITMRLTVDQHEESRLRAACCRLLFQAPFLARERFAEGPIMRSGTCRGASLDPPAPGEPMQPKPVVSVPSRVGRGCLARSRREPLDVDHFLAESRRESIARKPRKTAPPKRRPPKGQQPSGLRLHREFSMPGAPARPGPGRLPGKSEICLRESLVQLALTRNQPHGPACYQGEAAHPHSKYPSQRLGRAG